MSLLQSLFANVAPFFILLGVLIFVHEMGHFLVAKFFGVRVEVFSMGFGKKLLNIKRGDTAYCLSAIPLGGYVKMYGDDPTTDVPVDQRQYAFLHKPIWQRFAVVLAGPMMNLFFAIFVFSFIVGFGEDVAGPFLGDVATDTKAFQTGFRSGDHILKIGSEETPTWAAVQKQIETSAGQTVQVQVERKGSPAPLSIAAPVELSDNENVFSSDRQVGTIQGLTQDSRSTLIGVPDPASPAGKAGIQSLSQIVSVNGTKVSYWRDLESTLREASKPGTTELTVQVRELAGVDKTDKSDELLTRKVTLPQGWEGAKELVPLLGLEPAELYILQVTKGAPAERAGILAKDKVLRIGADPMKTWNDVLTKVKAFDPAHQPDLEFTVIRSGAEKTFHVKPEMTNLMNPNKGQEEHRYTIGILSGFFPVGSDPVFYRVTNPLGILEHGLSETWYWTKFIVMSIVRLVQGEVSPKNIGGVFTIGRVASYSFAAGMSHFLKMMGLISVNLFLINLLPIPVLDGGHLLFYSIESLRGSPLSMRKMEIAQQVGLTLLMFLMAFAFYNDIANYFFNRW